MKKLFIFLVSSIGYFSFSYAAFLVAEAPIKTVGTPATIAVSSTTLTKVPTTQTAGRMGIYVNNPSTNSVVGFFGDCTSTALASTIRPIEVGRTTNAIAPNVIYYFPLREDVCMWLISLGVNSATQNIHIQEVAK